MGPTFHIRQVNQQRLEMDLTTVESFGGNLTALRILSCGQDGTWPRVLVKFTGRGCSHVFGFEASHE